MKIHRVFTFWGPIPVTEATGKAFGSGREKRYTFVSILAKGMNSLEKLDGAPEMVLKPVGVVRNKVKEPILVAKPDDLEWRPKNESPDQGEQAAELVVDKSYAASLDGIEGFSHLLVLWWAHRIHPEGRALVKVHPRGNKDLPLTGIFATCSPARPNPVCATVVRLLERRENILRVQGLDAVDGSPIVDIKPYNPGYYAVQDVRVPDWMAAFYREKRQKERS